jgi:hypothetical protein
MSLAIFSMATGGKRLGGDLDRDLYGNFMSKGLPTDVSACLIRRAQRTSPRDRMIGKIDSVKTDVGLPENS